MLKLMEFFKRMTLIFTICFVVLCASIWAPGFGYSTGQEEKKRTAQVIIEGAKQEGQLMIYTSMGIGDMEILVSKFEERYPFLEVEYLRISGAYFVEKVFAEFKAEHYAADVLETSGFLMYDLLKEGVFQSYSSPEREAYPAGAKDIEGYWTTDRINTNVIAYNTDLVESEDIPKSYQDLLDPKWKGKLGLARNDVELFAYTLALWGEEEAREFWEELAETQPSLREGHTQLAELLAAGEFAIAVDVYAHRIEKIKAKEAPIEWVRTNPVIADPFVIALHAKAPHPNAGKVWINWILSEEGQQVISDLGRIPARPGVISKPRGLTEGINIYYGDPILAEHYNEYADEFRQILGLD